LLFASALNSLMSGAIGVKASNPEEVSHAQHCERAGGQAL
jgi:hypothetical protein